VAKIMGMSSQKLRLSHHLLHRGVSTLQGRLFVLSSAHTEADIDKTIAALEASLEAMISEGSLERL
jgi:glutamate-1-semialdehyde aminotransferase